MDELKDKVPRAGPKYRLGMYFETIHDLPEFDEVCIPEEGYSSYWETDTEIDDELGNFIFSNVAGDSASVICIDEAMDLLAIREQQQQLIDGSTELEQQLHQSQEEHFLERSTESKRSSSSRQSRRSHHSGSDGTYEGPPPPPLPPRRPGTFTSTVTTNSAQDHVYETLDDCKEDYEAEMAIYISKASDGSRESTDSTAKPATVDDESERSVDKGAQDTSRSPTKLVKHRSMSHPQPPEGVQFRHRRKLSEGETLSRKKKHHSSEVAPKSNFPPPIKGYNSPLGIPQDYAEYMALPNLSSSSNRRLSHDNGRKNSHSSERPPSLIIKHKGKTFIIPVLDKKLKQKLEKSKQHSTQMRLRTLPPCSSLPKHTTLNTLSRSNSACSASVYQTNNISRSHASPPKMEPAEQASSHKRRGKQTAQPSGQAQGPAHASKQVIHYGVV